VLTPQREDTVPTYQYACTDCGDRTEVVQKFTDEPLSVCATCGGRLRKVFSPVGIVFKGSGFYRTDSRKNAEPAGAAGGKDGAAKDGAKEAAAKDGGAKDGARSGSDKPSASGSSSGSSSESSGKNGSGSGSGGSSGEKKGQPGSSSSPSSGSKVA
jgi:putative FmdB family regulatory protein